MAVTACVCSTKLYTLAYVSQQGVCIQEDPSDPRGVVLNVKVRGERGVCECSKRRTFCSQRKGNVSGRCAKVHSTHIQPLFICSFL